MPSLDKKRIEQSLSKKGFIKDDGGRDHQYYRYCTADGKKTTIFTKLSHSSAKSISTSLVSMMARQCKLETNDFCELVNCSMGREKYENTLRAQGLLR